MIKKYNLRDEIYKFIVMVLVPSLETNFKSRDSAYFFFMKTHVFLLSKI